MRRLAERSPALFHPTPTLDEAAILRYHLFQDDFGEPGDRILSDKMVTARKEHTCSECLSTVHPGMRYRHHVGVYNGDLNHYRFCFDCCGAMAQAFDGPDDADSHPMEKRMDVRRANEEAKNGGAA